MQKLTQEEVLQLPKKHLGNYSPVYVNIFDLKANENLLITPQDWTVKYPISQMIKRISKRNGALYTLTHLAQNQGWVITRVK